LTSRGWVDPVPDPLLLRKSGSAGHRTRDLCICSQKLWPLDHDFVNWYLISGVSYMFRTLWVHPQGDSCICSVVWLTSIGVSSLLGRRVCSKRPTNWRSVTVRGDWRLNLTWIILSISYRAVNSVSIRKKTVDFIQGRNLTFWAPGGMDRT